MSRYYLCPLGEVLASSAEVQDWIDASNNEQVFSKIRDRLDDAAGDLPTGASAPEFDDKRGAVAFSMILSLTWQHGEQTELGMGSDEYIRNMLTSALGADKASGIIDRILLGRNSKGLEQLKWMDPRAIAELIRLEHPQIIAIVLSFLDPDQAAGVLSEFPERVRTDVIMRVASLDGIQPAALQELDEIREKQFSGGANVKSSALGGVKKAADILHFVDGAIESRVIEQISEADEELSQKIQDNMFVFENLIDVDDRGMQTLLREVSSEQLLLALRGAPEPLREKIFKNMSSRAAEMLKDDLEAAPPAKLSDVEAAQKEILTVARRLSDAGEINLGGSGGEEFI